MKRFLSFCQLVLLLLSLLLLPLPSWSQEGRVEPLFPCGKKLRESYGFCSHVTRPATDYPFRHADLDMLHRAGARWVRSDFDWWTLYPKGMAQDERPEVFDTVLIDCKAQGVKLLPVLDRGCLGKFGWDVPEGYDRYVRYVAERYKGKTTYWEVVNEANLIDRKRTAEIVEGYASLLRRTSATLRQVNRHNKVVLGGLADLDDDDFLDRFCQTEGIADQFDIMNFHSYRDPEELIGTLQHLHETMNRYGLRKPLWITETGYSTPPTHAERTEAEQARRVARACLICFAHGVEKVFWYHLRSFENHPTDWEHYYGVLHRDLSPKDGYIAYQTLTRFCPDGSTRPVLTVRDGLYCATWKHPRLGRIAAYWVKTGKRTVPLPRLPRAIYSFMGEQLPPVCDLHATDGVTFVLE